MKAKLHITLLFISTLLIGFQANAKTENSAVTDTLTINWKPMLELRLSSGGVAKLFYFEDAITRYETASLPWQITELPLSNKEKAQNLQLIVIAADTIPCPTENEAADLQFANEDFKLALQDFEGKDFATVMPLKIKDGKLIRLLAYQLSYETTERLQEEVDNNPDWANSSVLASGNWFKIGITETGVYKLDYNQLQQMGLDPGQLNPRHFGLFGNGSGMLPEANHISRPDDLIENAIYIYGENDGSFDEGDYVLFFGQEAVSWKYSSFINQYVHQQNYYSDTTFYFFTPDLATAGKRIAQQAQATGNPDATVDYFLDYQLHEKENENLILSGKEWFGEVLSKANPVAAVNFDFPNLIPEKPVGFYTRYAGRSISEDTYVSLLINGQSVQDSTKMHKLSANNPMYARDKTFMKVLTANSDRLEVKLQLMAKEVGSRIWLDYIRINAWRQLKVNNGKLHFRFIPEAGIPAVVNLKISDIDNDHILWDISDFSTIKEQHFSASGSTAQFKLPATSRHEFYLFKPQNALNPTAVYPINNQNLHQLQSTEMLVISHPRFLAQANDIAEVHQTVDQLDVKVVDVMEIYNEFGSGSPDITAIRDFIRMIYLRGNKQLKYVLLFGDASYDYKDRIDANTNLIPTYQASASLITTNSFVSDDYFGLMDTNEGLEMDGILDLGIGRFPVNEAQEAQVMVDKVQHYLSKQAKLTGQWRNNIAFTCDDGNDNMHFTQAESLSRIVDTARANLNLSKIYFDAYLRTTVAGGVRFPDANKAFVKQIEDGALIINYTGHGGVNGLSDERVFTIPDINALKNIDNMPFFITATCEFSRFDDPGFVSAGEQLLLTSKGGGIALMTTTRQAFAHTNFALNKKVYAAMFDRRDANFKRLGDILRLSKNPTSSSVYNFVLLGDPALKLVYPESKAITTRVNSIDVGTDEIVLHAMSEVSIEGEILNPDGSQASDFNGYLYPKLFDKKTRFSTLGSSSDSQPAPFSYYEKLLYSGKITVTNGKFNFRFQLPRDIAYQFGQAKLSYYAVDTLNFNDASGHFDLFEIGGTDPDIIPDNKGPEITLYVNNKTFKNGDIVPSNSMLIAQLSDPQGIHYIGNSIGRDIVLQYISPAKGSVILNSHFEPQVDKFGAGTIHYPLDKLEDGFYQLTLKAWDLHNNSSTAEITFVVDRKAKLELHRVLNYPNPFSTSTAFVFDHNKPQTTFEFEITVYALDGRPIVILSGKTGTVGNRSEPILWDGKNASGQMIPAGTYVYRILLTDEQGIQHSVNQIFVKSGN